MADPTVDVSPVTGLMDVRSGPDTIPFGSYRHVLNCHSVLTDKLARMSGWEKLLSQDNYNNQDLHDQFVPAAEREPVTMIFEGISTSKARKLFVGTATRIFALNNSTGNWKQIAGPYGTPTSRWQKPAQVEDTILFTNSENALVYHIFDQPDEADGQSVLPVPDLQKFNVTSAEVVVSWKDLMILCNIVQDGQFYSNRVMWSDFKRPLSYAPSTASVAGNFDLTSGEAILAAMPLGNVLLLYTNFGIWEVNATGGEEVLSFNKRYEPHRNTTRCLAFRNTLLSIGSSHLFGGHDGIYSYDLYHIEPTLVDYIHKGSGLIYNTIDKKCDLHCAGFNPNTKEAIFSWAKTGEDKPSSSLLINMDQAFTSELDHGFTAYGNFTAPSSELSIFQYILEQCICTEDQLREAGLLDGTEFQVCHPVPAPVCPDSQKPQSFYTQTPLRVYVDPDDPTSDFTDTEDYLQAEADSNSFCGIYPGLTLNNLCAEEYRADECPTGVRFVAASAVDFALKQFTNVYFRERVTDFSPCGKWALDGYRSRVRSGAMGLGVTKHPKKISRFEIEALSEPQTKPSQLTLRIGTAAQALDPNTASGRCAIMWEEQDPKPLDCLSEETAAEHLADGTVPNETLEWPLYRQGRYLYFEWEISNPPNDTGGAATFSRYSIDVAKEERNYP